MTFYVTAEEKEALKKRMELIGLKNMSTYLRKLALDGYLLNVDMSCFDKALEDIHGVSKNINQIAKRINSTDNIYAEDMRQLKQKQEEIWQREKYEIKSGKYISFRAEGQERFTRSKTLGTDYTEEQIRNRIAGGKRIEFESSQRVSLIIDIENASLRILILFIRYKR